MRRLLISVVKPRIIREGKPTQLTRRLMMTPKGRAIVRYMLTYYLETDRGEGYDYYDLDTNINIEDYRIVGKDEDNE